MQFTWAFKTKNLQFEFAGSEGNHLPIFLSVEGLAIFNNYQFCNSQVQSVISGGGSQTSWKLVIIYQCCDFSNSRFQETDIKWSSFEHQLRSANQTKENWYLSTHFAISLLSFFNRIMRHLMQLPFFQAENNLIACRMRDSQRRSDPDLRPGSREVSADNMAAIVKAWDKQPYSLASINVLESEGSKGSSA